MSKRVKKKTNQSVNGDSASLTKSERKSLLECENQIEQCQKDFITMGKALTRINETQLYKGMHNSFDKYCEERWGFTGSHARRFMVAYEVIAKLQTGKISEANLPRNEYQARLLFDNVEEKKTWVTRWKKVVGAAKKAGTKITASVIQGILVEKPKKPSRNAKASVKKPTSVVDKALKKIERVRQRLEKNENIDWNKWLNQIESFLKANA